MHAKSGDEEIFADLKTGDKIFIVHDWIRETYPGQTGVYASRKLGEGYEVDLPEGMLSQLREMGWSADNLAKEGRTVS